MTIVRTNKRKTIVKPENLCSVWRLINDAVYHEVLNQNETLKDEEYYRQLKGEHNTLQKETPIAGIILKTR